MLAATRVAVAAGRRALSTSGAAAAAAEAASGLSFTLTPEQKAMQVRC